MVIEDKLKVDVTHWKENVKIVFVHIFIKDASSYIERGQRDHLPTLYAYRRIRFISRRPETLSFLRYLSLCLPYPFRPLRIGTSQKLETRATCVVGACWRHSLMQDMSKWKLKLNDYQVQILKIPSCNN